MANLLKWNTRGAWTNAFEAADLQNLANGSSILSTSTVLDNSGGDVFCDLSFRWPTDSFTPSANGYGLDIYLLPILDDASTYPDGDSTSTAANQATGEYWVGRIALSGKATAGHAGMLRRIEVHNGKYKWYCVNNCGVTLPNTTNSVLKYSMYEYTLNG
jgi:hypothetical protein